MIKSFPIEFVRQTFEQTFLMEHIKDQNYFGGKSQISLSSFFQQLKNQDEVDRFVETFKDLTEQQNRLNLIGNGILLSPENPTITNLYTCLIIPMTYTCAIRCQLFNRDQMLDTINHLIDELKGSKVDIAQLKCIDENGKVYYQPFMVGTIGHNDGAPKLKNGDYIGSLDSATDLNTIIENLAADDIEKDDSYWFYCENDNLLKVVALLEDGVNNIVDGIDYEYQLVDGRYLTFDITAAGHVDIDEIVSVYGNFFVNGDETVTLENISGVVDSYEYQGNETTITLTFDLGRNVTEIVTNFQDIDIDEVQVNEKNYTPQFIEDDGTYDDIIFPPEHTSFEKYKLSLSFESLRCDTPYTLDGEEYCEISFGGSATLVNDSIRLGNDLVKVSISKYQIKKSNGNITYSTPTTYYVEPLEMPSGSNANTKAMQMVSNNFITNSHTDALSITLQYSFVCDFNVPLLKQWFKYARYGTQNINDSNDVQTMSPNIIYDVNEYWSSWGVVDIEPLKAKIVGNIDVENTEGDTLTLSLTMQKQGEE